MHPLPPVPGIRQIVSQCLLVQPPAIPAEQPSDSVGQPTEPSGQSTSSQSVENSDPHSDPQSGPPADPTSETDDYTKEMQRQLKNATQYPLPENESEKEVSSAEGVQEVLI